MPDFSMFAGAAGFAGNIVNNAVQYFTQKNQQRQAQSNERKNMQLQSELEQQGYYNNIVRTPQALRDAGLNPAAATGMNIAAPSVTHSGNSQSVGMQTNAADIVNSAILSKSQKDLNEAAAEKAKAEADNINQKTRHADTKDYFINSHLYKVLENVRDSSMDEFTKDFAQSFIDENSKEGMNLSFDQGALDAIQDIFFTMERSKRHHQIEELTNDFDKKVMQMQLSNGAASALANVHKDNRKLIYKNMLQMAANIGKLNSEKNLNDKQRVYLESQIQRNGQEIMSMLHNDPVAMYNSGEIGDLAVKLLFEGGTQFAHGAGFGTGMAIGSRVAKALPESKAGTPELTLPKFGTKSADPSSMPRNVFEQIKKSAHERANGDKVYEAKLIDASVRRWKAEHK